MTLVSAFTPRERDILQLMTVDLSNAEIAERLVMTPGTVKWYVKEIYSKLDVHSRDEAIDRASDLNLAPQTQPARSTPTNLPPPATSLIGREREIADVRQHLLREDVRLLTLVGTPGIGKTRLSLETARTFLSEFSNGVYFVPLAPVSDPALVPNTIAQALGVQEMGGQSIIQVLKHYLREKSLLLVLDNFEHLLSAVSLVADMLAGAPWLKVLATSREALRLYGEQEYPVPPLALPDPKVSDGVETPGEYEAVALFVKRAQAVKPEFELTSENATAIADICIRLDGLPLAIELAAARVRLHTPAALLWRLNKRLHTLTGGARDLPERQQTLRGAIAWSYELLNEGEKTLFGRLGVFVGGWSLEAMEVVCSADLTIDVYEGLESLLNKSLVQPIEVVTSSEPRFTMLETLREYALEKLAEVGEEEAVRRLHAEYFVLLAEATEPELHLEDHLAWLNILEAEHGNLRGALAWCQYHSIEQGLRLVGSIYQFWTNRGHAVEGGEWVERLLASSKRVSIENPPVWARTLNVAARLAYVRGDVQSLCGWAEEALCFSLETADTQNTLWALRSVGQTAALQGDHEKADRYFGEGLARARDMGDDWFTTFFLNSLGISTRNQGNYDRAISHHEEAVRLIKQTDDRMYVLIVLWEMGTSLLFAGDYEQARRCYADSLRLSQVFINRAYCLEGFGGVAGAQKQPIRAARLLGAAQALREQANTPRLALDRYYDRFMTEAREQLDEASFATAWAEGAQMTMDQAVAYALSENGC